MRMIDLIEKKKAGKELSEPELRWLIDGVTDGSLPDYQLSAFLMAVIFRGMTHRETAWMTDAMAKSGDQVDLSCIEGVKVDKHSTGGVGDKTTLILAPIVAACGLPVAKMSGRGLGHTGGTVDKLESIPGYQTSLDREAFLENVRRHGICVVGQSGNLAPADKKLYALRDVTGTVDSIPLIAASIMSKKIAAGADGIVLDVKCGSGAFMKTAEDAAALAKEMVEIGRACGRKMAAVITNMDIPLGKNIGNGLEVAEAVQVLQGEGPEDLRQVSFALATQMLVLAGKGTPEACSAMVQKAVDDGSAFRKLCEMVTAQGGDASVLNDPACLYQKAQIIEAVAERSGWVQQMNAEEIGRASMILGAGRETKDDVIDPAAGIVLLKKTGDQVEKGEVLARMYTNRPEKAAAAAKVLRSSYRIDQSAPQPMPLIFEIIR